MSKCFNLSSIAFLFSLFFLVSSCTNDDTTTANTDTTVTTNTAAGTDALPATTTPSGRAFAGTLDILIAERDTMLGWPEGSKIVFTHNFGADGKVHLTGWVKKGNAFETKLVPLENGGPSEETYDASTFFSNVVLHPGDFNKIRTALERDANYKYVLFRPKKVNGYFIGYDIYPSIVKALAQPTLAATAEANPSPPKIY